MSRRGTTAMMQRQREAASNTGAASGAERRQCGGGARAVELEGSMESRFGIEAEGATTAG